MDVKTKNILKEVAFTTVGAGIGFGVGCLVGKMAKGPVLITGAVYAAYCVADRALNKLAEFLTSKFKWNLSTHQFSKALIGTVLATALAVSAFALGIFGPVGLGVGIGLGLIFPAYHLGMGLYAKFGKKDMVYDDAVKFAKKQPAEEASDKEKTKLAQQQLFYKFATG